MKKVLIILTVVLMVSFSSIILASDFKFPGITTKEQVRLELWVKGVKPTTQEKKEQTKLNIELQETLKYLK